MMEEELKRQGAEIARQLGISSPLSTRTTFYAADLESTRAKLKEKRELFNEALNKPTLTVEQLRAWQAQNRENERCTTQDRMAPTEKCLGELRKFWWLAFHQDPPKVTSQAECGNFLRYAYTELDKKRRCG